MAFKFLLLSCCTFLALQLAFSSTVKDFTESSGTIKSELKDGHYYNNVEEVYNVRVPSGNRAKLSFKSFDVLGSMPNCTEDSLEIYVGCSSKSVGKFCSCGLLNGSKPFDIYSMDECIKLVLKTDKNNAGKGFEAVYSSFNKKESVSNASTCSNLNQQTSGNFFSPLWPNNYLANSTCTWKLTIPNGYMSKIYFMNFRIEDSHSCSQLSVVDDQVGISALNGTSNVTIVKRLCSAYKDSTFDVSIGKYPVVYTKFFTDADKVESVSTGFAAGFLSFKTGTSISTSTCSDTPDTTAYTPTTTATPNTTTTPTTATDPSLASEAIIGIAVGCAVVFIAAVVILVYCCYCKKKKPLLSTPPESHKFISKKGDGLV